MSAPEARRALARVEAGIEQVGGAAADPDAMAPTAAVGGLVEALDDLDEADLPTALALLADRLDVLESVTAWMLDSGRGDVALGWLTDIVDDTGDSAVRVLLGRLLAAEHRLQEASDAAARVLAAQPDDLDALMLAGNVAMAQADDAERTGDVGAAQAARRAALRIGSRLTTVAPGEPAFWAAIAELHVGLDEGQLAAAAYDRALELAPDDPAMHLALGSFHARRGQLEEAEEAYRRAVALDPEFVPNRLALAQFLAAAGRIGEARAEVSEVLERDAQDVDALVLAANLAVDAADVAEGEGDVAAARAALRDALEVYERLEVPLATNPSLWVAVAEVHGRLDEGDDAVAAYGRALELAPDDPDVETKVGLFYEDRGQWAEALAHYERTIELAPDSSIGWRNRGDALAGLDRGEEAEEAYRRAVALDPEFVPNRLALAQFLAAAGRIGEARAEVSEVLERDPLIVDELLAAGDVAMSIADGAETAGDADAARAALDDALRAFERLHELAPAAAMTWIATGDVRARLGDVNEAIAAYSEALDIEPENTEALIGRGFALIDGGQHHRADWDFEHVLEVGATTMTDVDRTRALLGRAESLNALSDFYGTKDLYQRAADCAEQALGSARLAAAGPWPAGARSAHWFAGKALITLEAFDQAIEQFELAIGAGAPESVPWWLSYDRADAARLHAEVSGDPERRVGVVTSLHELAASTDDPEERLTALCLAGLALLEFDQPSEAAGVLGAALQDDDGYFWGHGLLGRAHALVSDGPNAIAELRIAANPEADAGTRLDATVGLEVLGVPLPVVPPDGSDEPTDTAVESAEAIVSARMTRASALERFGAFAMATDEYRRAVAEQPSSAAAKNGLAWHLVDRVGTPEAIDEAIMLAEAAGELEQADDRAKGNYLDTLGWALFLKGEFDRAAEALSRAVRLSPFDFEIRLHELRARGRASAPATPQDGSPAP